MFKAQSSKLKSIIMRRFSAIIFLLCTFALAMSAQHIQRNYHNRSMSDVLIDLDKASNGYDLLDNLSLPTIIVNRAERKVLSLKGGDVQIRINDVKASMQDVLALQPDEVTKVEFINVPGLKYGDSNLDAVINYQVRRRYAGYVGGVSTMQGTKTGFNNSDGYFKYNVKKSEFSINYSFSYRSVEERSYESLGTYHLPTGETLHRNYLGYDSPFLYTTNNVQLGYNLSEPDKYTLNVRLNFFNYNSPVRGMNQLYQESGKANQYLQNNRKMLEQIPSLDIYYSLNMPHDQNLALNLVGTYIGTDYQYRMREYTFNKSPDESVKNAPLTDYSYDATGRKRSLIGEGTYSKNWKQMALSVGGQYNISHTDNIYVGSSNADTELKYSNLYLFTQLQGQQKWFSYQVGVGATRSSIHQGENGYSKWLFRPQVTLQAKASDRLSFKWSSKITSDIPSLSDLSELRQYLY